MKAVYFNYLDDRLGISIGSTRKAELLMEELNRLGYDIRIYWRRPLLSSSQAGKKQKHPALRKILSYTLHESVQFLRNFKYFIEESEILRFEKPDLIIVRTQNLLFSAALLAKLFRIPLLVEADAPNKERQTFHKEFWTIPHFGEWIEKTVMRSALLIICVSNVAKKHFIQQGILEYKLRVIPNGANPERLMDNASTLRKSLDINDRLVVGFVGSFHYWHGIDILIQLMERLLPRYEKCVFLLVGHGGPKKTQVESFVSDSPYRDRIILTGYVSYEKIPEYLSAMDIALAPYPDMEFFHFSPVKIYEYMAAGKPVVSSDIGQIHELITPEIDGIICPPGDIDCFFANLSILIENPEKREKIGYHARQTIIQKHTWVHRAHAWAKAINSVLQTSEFRPDSVKG